MFKSLKKMNVTTTSSAFSFSTLFLIIIFLIKISFAFQYNCGSCPQGTSCDSNTGICRQFRPPAEAGNGGGYNSPCSYVRCPYGKQCDENTGQCQVFRDPSSSNRCQYVQCPPGSQCDSNYGVCQSYNDPSTKNCRNVFCPQGTSCDSNTGVCRQFRPPALFRRVATIVDKCASVKCPNGYTCDSMDGVCKNGITTTTTIEPVNYEIFEAEKLPQHPSSPSIAWRRPTQEFCPPNSEYVECGTRCPYTCTELHPRCSTNEHNCIGACQCLDGFIQTSSANVSCIPARDCTDLSEKLCEGLKCPTDMICTDGYCNPVNCPPILKPNLERGCQYELVRDTRNCVVLKSSCDEEEK